MASRISRVFAVALLLATGLLASPQSAAAAKPAPTWTIQVTSETLTFTGTGCKSTRKPGSHGFNVVILLGETHAYGSGTSGFTGKVWRWDVDLSEAGLLPGDYVAYADCSWPNGFVQYPRTTFTLP